MTAEGFCIPCGADVPVDAERTCLVDGLVTIPPSYGKRIQKWVNGNWSPLIAKPDGWVWKAPAEAAPKAVEAKPPSGSKTFACANCQQVTRFKKRGSTSQRYCSNACKNRALAARRWAAKAVAS